MGQVTKSGEHVPEADETAADDAMGAPQEHQPRAETIDDGRGVIAADDGGACLPDGKAAPDHRDVDDDTASAKGREDSVGDGDAREDDNDADGGSETEDAEDLRASSALDAGEQVALADLGDVDSSDADGCDADDGSDVADVALGEVRLDGSWIEAAPRPFSETISPFAALVLAAGLHASVLLPFSSLSATARLGAGGDDLQSISVDIITVERAALATGKNRSAEPTQALRGPAAETSGRDVASVAQDDQAESVASNSGAQTLKSAASAQTAAAPLRLRETQETPAEDAVVSAKRVGETRDGLDADEANDADTDTETAGRVVEGADGVVENATSKTDDAENWQPQKPVAVDSAGAAASEAAEEGGGQRLAALTDGDGARSASLAAGIIAKAYGAEIVKSLHQLEQYLNLVNRERKSAVRGRVELILTIDGDGRARDVKVVKSSGQPSLDRIAQKDIEAFRFPVPPPALSVSVRTYRLPITYR